MLSYSWASLDGVTSPSGLLDTVPDATGDMAQDLVSLLENDLYPASW